jgi:membrane protein implicated in regulation of membrane protease activity
MLTKPAGVFLQMLGWAVLIIGVLLMVASGGLVLGGVLALVLGLGLLWFGRRTHRGGQA